jgi:glycosyltransferase involved in cell wall biosynthesis
MSEIRVVHMNWALTGIGRYGLCLGQALSDLMGKNVLSVFNRELLERTGLTQVSDLNFEYRSYRIKTWKEQILSSISVIQQVRDFAPGLIHISSGSVAPLGVKLLLWPIMSRLAPILITEHDPSPHSGVDSRWPARLGRKVVHHFAAHYLVHGQKCREMLKDKGISGEKISLGRHGTFVGQCQQGQPPISRDQNRVLFFGALRPNKGVELLLPIADEVIKWCPQARFVVAGSADFGRELDDRAWPSRLQGILQEMRSRPYFEVHDRFVPESEVDSFFYSSAITLLPYLDATQSGVAMLAMPRGAAVVATNVGDLGEVVRHEETGLLCSANVHELAMAVIDLLRNSKKRQRIAASAHDFVHREYSWASIASHLLELYTSLQHSKLQMP